MENKTAKVVANFATAVIDHRAAERFAASVGIKTQHPAKATPVRTRRTGLISSIVFFALFLLFGYAANATYSSAAYTGNGMTGATLSLSGLAVLNLTIAVIITVVSTIRALIRKANAPEQAVAQATTSPESESESAAEVVDDLPLSKEDKAAMIAERQKFQWEGIVRGVLYRLLEEKGPYVSDINTAKDFVTTSYNKGVRKDHEAAEAKLVTYYKMKGQRYTKKPAPARLTFDEAFPPGGFRDQVVRSVLDPVVGIDYQVSAQKALVRLTLPIVATVKDAQALVEPLRTSFDTIRDVVLINPTKDDPRTVTLELWFTEKPDLLLKAPVDSAFLDEEEDEEHRSDDPRRMTIAIKEDGDRWSYELHHSIIVGTTGAGKNSVPWAMLRRTEAHIRAGRMLPWAVISPVDRQLKLFRFSTLFDEFSGGTAEETVGVVSAVYSLLLERQRQVDGLALLHPDEYAALEARGELPTFPVKALLWDEFNTTYPELKDTPLVGDYEPVLDKRGKLVQPTVEVAINKLKAQGRQYGMFLIAVAQEFIEEKIGSKANFQYIIMLRVPPSKTQWVASAFGPEAMETFAKTNTGPHTIPNLPNSGSAGIGYVYDTEQESVLRVRFPFTSPEDINRLRQRVFDPNKAALDAAVGVGPQPHRVPAPAHAAMPPRPVLLPTPVDDPFPEGS